MSHYREQLEAWLQKQHINAHTVFDIGGAQGRVQGRVSSWDVLDYRILDLPDYDIEEELGLSEKNNWTELADSADLVFCLEVFEYLIDPYQAMQNIQYVMKTDGRAYITFAFVYPHHNELELDSTRYTESGVKRLVESAGLQVTNMWYRTDKSGLLKAFYQADGMRAAKQYPHHNVTGFIVEVTK